MKKPNYVRKAEIMRDFPALFKEVGKINKAFYADYALQRTGEIINSEYNSETALKLQSFYLEKCPKLYKEVDRIRKSCYKRSERVKKRILDIIATDNAIFLTLTFKPEILESTTEDTRKRYVRRYLEKNTFDYVANIDYGKKNEREHYHAVVFANSVNYTEWHKIGAINGERVHKAKSDVALSKYITKLSNHAIKSTNKRCVVMYCRKPKLVCITENLPF